MTVSDDRVEKLESWEIAGWKNDRTRKRVSLSTGTLVIASSLALSDGKISSSVDVEEIEKNRTTKARSGWV